MKFGEHTGELRKGKGEPLEHFSKEDGKKDRFGNQYLTSKEFTYFDRGLEQISAGILISSDGQSFIAKHPLILHEMEEALLYFETKYKYGNTSITDLSDGISLQIIKHNGSQSNFYILITPEGKYAVKTHVHDERIIRDKTQPYINEMLQTQAVALDLKGKLDKLGVKMSDFLFASGQVSCTKYYEEEGNQVVITEQRLTSLFNIVEEYIEKKQNKHDKLWDYIEVDSNGNMESMPRNFRTKKDGTMVWIDPFIYEG